MPDMMMKEAAGASGEMIPEAPYRAAVMEGRNEAVLLRKIIHIDEDAFYASVEQRDDRAPRGRPIAVGGLRERRCRGPYNKFLAKVAFD